MFLLILKFFFVALFWLFPQLQTSRRPPGQHATPVPPLSQGEACETQPDDKDDCHGAGEGGGKMEVYYAP